MLLYSEHSHKICYTDLHSLTEDTSFITVPSTLCLPSSSWVPDLNLNRSLKPIDVRDSIQVLLALKILFQISINS